MEAFLLAHIEFLVVGLIAVAAWVSRIHWTVSNNKARLDSREKQISECLGKIQADISEIKVDIATIQAYERGKSDAEGGNHG